MIPSRGANSVEREDAPAAPGDVLNSWKEIAAYLGKDVRTCMRWERNLALPVRRLPGGPKAGVFALKPELDVWRRDAGARAAHDGNTNGARTLAPAERRTSRLKAGVVVACVVATASALAYWYSRRPPTVGEPAPMTRLTYDRYAAGPTISADGKLFAYSSNREGKSDIYLQQIGGHQPIRITRNAAENWHPALSPDGSRIAYRSDRDGGGLYVAEAFGGAEQKIADRGASPRFSPDGKAIVYLVPDPFTRMAAMFIVPAAGGVSRPFQPDFRVPPFGPVYPAPMWSSDGEHIMFDGVGTERALWVAPADGGSAVPVQGVPAVPLGKIRIFTAWAGEYLYYVEGTSVHGAPLMRVRVAPRPWRLAGQPEQLTSSSIVSGLASVSATGRVVLQVASSAVNTIWSVPLQAESAKVGGPLRQETPDAYNQLRMTVAASGARFAYLGNPERGELEIRVVDATSRRLTSVPVNDRRVPIFRLSPDGQRLAYRDLVAGKDASYVVRADDPSPGESVCDDCWVAGFFSTSPDLLVVDARGAARQEASSGARSVLVEGRVADPVLSPDNAWLAFVAPQPGGSAGLSVVPVGHAAVPRSQWRLVDDDRNYIGSPQWSPSGRILYYLSNRDSFSCVWARTFDAATREFGEPMHVFHDPVVPSIKTSTSRTIGVTPERLYLFMAAAEASIWTMELPTR